MEQYKDHLELLFFAIYDSNHECPGYIVNTKWNAVLGIYKVELLVWSSIDVTGLEIKFPPGSPIASLKAS